MLLGSCIDYQPSEGTYAYLGKIYANMVGVIVISAGQDQQEVVSVVTKSQFEKMQGQEQSDNVQMDEEANTAAEDSFEMIPREGDLVYGRITKLEDRFVRVDILAIEDRPL